MKNYFIVILSLLGITVFASEGFFQKVDESARYLNETIDTKPKLLIVLTAGIKGPLDLLEDKVEISSADIPHFPIAKVPGHEGKLIFGKLDGVDIVLMKGRYHYYEGISPQEVVFPYFVLNSMGVESVITMNAVGGIREDLDVGDIMLVTDHINLLCNNPLKGVSILQRGREFTDMSNAYDCEYQEVARNQADLKGIELKTGVYTALSGPNYETKAEIRMLRTLGADFVGMSTIFEVLSSRFLEMRVLAFSCITNPAADRNVGKISHEHVLKALNDMNPKLSDLVTGCAKELILK
ncbi:MAG: Purine nucleoside phosphorylase 1 [Chlamydiia bacterium]|nr:Purine nucleoside phosphorylase 1 [Chlamydiia bacterium]